MTLAAIESQTSTQANNETRVGETRAPSRWGWPLAREITIIAVGLLLYRLVRLLAMGEIDTALLNSQRIVDWERALGIFNEVGLQSLVLGNDAIVWMLNRYYFLGHFLGMAMLLTWLYVAHYDYYGRVRRVLITLHGGRVDHPCELPVGTTALVSSARFCGHTPDLRSQDLRQRDDCHRVGFLSTVLRTHSRSTVPRSTTARRLPTPPTRSPRCHHYMSAGRSSRVGQSPVRPRAVGVGVGSVMPIQSP